MRPGEGGQHGAALLDGGEPDRVGLDAVGVGGAFGGDVGDQVPDLAEALAERGERRVVTGDLVERPAGSADERGDVRRAAVVRVAGQSQVGLLGGEAQLLGVAESLRLGAQSDVLPRLRLDALDLRQPDPEKLRLLGALPGARHDLLEPALDVPQSLPRGPVAGEDIGHGAAGEPVERLALPGRRSQPQLVGLAVHGDEPLGELGEQSGGDRPAADEAAPAALGGDAAGDDENVAVVEFRARLERPHRDGPAGSTTIRPSTCAVLSPSRTVPTSDRPPRSSPSPVTTMVLPAPVSPVTTVRPGPSSRTASAITPRPRRRISRSTTTLLPPPPGHDAEQTRRQARHRARPVPAGATAGPRPPRGRGRRP